MSEPLPSPSESGSIPDSDATAGPEAAGPALRIRYRIRFAKEGLLRWISHRDLARLWERMLRRAEFRLSMTEGFHPKPRIAFPSALALGVEGLREVVEIELSEDLSPQEVLGRLQADNQPGLRIREVFKLPDGFGKAQLKRSDYTLTMIEDAEAASVDSSIARLLAQETVTVQRKNKPMRVELASQIVGLQRVDRLLRLSLAASDAASLRPIDVLELLGFDNWIEHGCRITRVDAVLQKDLQSQDPEIVAVADSSHAPSEPSATPEPSTPSDSSASSGAPTDLSTHNRDRER